MAIIDNFLTYSTGVSGPLDHAEAVTPSNAADLTRMSRAIYVGGAGNLRVTMKGKDEVGDNAVVTFTNLSIGWHPIRVSRIWATGTTATDIVAGS